MPSPLLSWPALAYEDAAWQIAPEIEPHLDIWQKKRLERPYRAALPAAVADADPAGTLTRETLALAQEASVVATEFDAETAGLPTRMPAVLLRTESASSSRIEHLTSSARNLAIATLGLPSRENAALVAANVGAMTTALALGDAITPETVLDVHRALLAHEQPDIAGRWRDRQVWVGTSSISPHGADFVPPVADRVPAAVDDLCAFAARDDVPALVQAAVVHAQFETIHPFEDGNGRTGRVLIHTVLRRSGVVRRSTVPVSAGLLRDPEAYFRALTSYREGDLDPVVAQIADGALAAVANGRALLADVVATRAAWHDRITARTDSLAWRLADLLFAQPVVTAAYAAQVLDASDRGARNALDVLARAEVLRPSSAGRRNQVWQAPDVLRAMDAFAERSGRRRTP